MKPNHFVHDSLGDPRTCTEDHNHPEPEQTPLNEVAQAGYEAYVQAQGGKAFDGSPLPPWEAVREDIQTAWECAAIAMTSQSAWSMPERLKNPGC